MIAFCVGSNYVAHITAEEIADLKKGIIIKGSVRDSNSVIFLHVYSSKEEIAGIIVEEEAIRGTLTAKLWARLDRAKNVSLQTSHRTSPRILDIKPIKKVAFRPPDGSSNCTM